MSSADQDHDGPESNEFSALVNKLLTFGEETMRSLGSTDRNYLQIALSRAAGLLDQLVAISEPVPAGGLPTKPTDPIDSWVCDLTTAIHSSDKARLVEAAQELPKELPAAIVSAAKSHATGHFLAGTGPLLDYLLGRFARLDSETAIGLRPAAASTAILAARLHISDTMTDAVEKRCQGYLQLAHAHGGLTARYEAALAEFQRARGENGLAQESASRACELEPGYARAHLELALSMANASSDPTEKIDDAVEAAGRSPDPIIALTDLVGGLPGVVLLQLAQHSQQLHPDVARQALDLLLDGSGGNQPLSHEGPQAATRRIVDGYLLRVSLATEQGDDDGAQEASGGDAIDATGRVAEDLFAAASAMYGINEDKCLELLDRVLALDPDHRASLLMRCDAMRVKAESAVPPDPGRLSEAVAAFELAVRTEASGDTEWEQRVIAGLRDSQASAEPEQSFGFLIDAVARLEQSILVGDESGWTHLIQSRLFRRLDMWAWANSALQRAQALLGDNPLLMDELIVVDLTCGNYASALERIDRHPSPTPLMGAARGFAVLELGHPAEAVSALEHFVALGQPPAWCLQSLAAAYRQLGRTEDALAALESILSAERTTWHQNGSNAVAAMRLGRLADAEQWLESWSADPSDQATRCWRLGLCRLPSDPAGAREMLITGLQAESLPAALLGIDWDLEVVRHAVEAVNDDGRRLAGLALLRDAEVIIDRQLKIEPDLTGRANELDRVRHRWFPLPGDAVETVAREGDLPLATTVLTALRGRCAAEMSLHETALLTYQELRGTRLGGETGRAIDASLAALRDAIDEAISDDDLSRGWGAFLAASRLHTDIPGEDINVRGIALAVRLRDAAGLDLACRQALSPDHTNDHVARSLLELAADVSLSADDLVDALRSGSADEPGSAPAQLATAIRRVEAQSMITRLEGDPIRADYDPRPLRVELGSELVPVDTSNNWKLFHTDIPELRARVLEESGLLLPGIHVNSSDDIPAAGYRVLLGGLEATVGTITRATADLPIADCLEPITDAIERVVLSAPGTFMMISELDRLTGQLELVDGDILPQLQFISEMVELLDDPKRSYRLLSILRAFLNDGVRATDWVDLVRIVNRSNAVQRDDPQAVARQLRRKLRGHLFARPGTIGVHLSSEIEQLAIAASSSKEDGRTNSNARPSQSTSTVMNALAGEWMAMTEVAGNPPLVTIVVETERTRSWLQLRLREQLLPAVAITVDEAARIGISIVEPVKNIAGVDSNGGIARSEGGAP